MSALFEKRVTEYALYYHGHIQEIRRNPDTQRTREFLLLYIDGLLELLAIAAKDIQQLERANNGRSVNVMLPKGVILHDALRR